MKKFIFIFIILITIGAIAAYWHLDRKTFSKDDIKLEILGPREVEMTEEVEFIVRYRNIGHIRLDNPELVFEFPDNAILEPGVSHRQKLGREELGIAIYPGEERTFRFRAKLLGEEGEVLTTRAALSYQPKGLAVRFESVTTFTTIIKSVPIAFTFDFPPKIEPGKDFQFQINYFSRVDYPLLGLRIIADYPDDFEFTKAFPRALEKNEWDLPPLNKAEGGRIEITGRISGQPGDQKLFRANLGIWKEGEFITLKRIAKGVELIKPSLSIIQRINGNKNHTIRPGEHLHYEILFRNIGDETLTSLSLTVNLFGKTLDLNTLGAPEGNFVLGDNSITWDWKDVSALQFLEPQEEGRVEFWLQAKSDWPVINLRGETVARSVVFMGELREEFVTKVNSKLEACQRIYFQDEIFGNTGSLPPRVGLPTTYTVMWRVKNHYNRVQNVEMKAILPKNVKLTGEIFPEAELENFTFDSESREIVWKVGEMEVGRGVINPTPNISFQIVFIPDRFQIGTTPNLISSVEVTGKDLWTEQILINIDEAIDTTLPDDPLVTQAMGIIE